jgi:hypothetical protein
MTPISTWEYSDRRILAVLRFVDTLGRPARGPVAIVSPGVRFFVRRPGEIIVTGAPGFDVYAASFLAPPATPAVGSVTVPLDFWPSDPALAARRFALALPRDPDPANAATSTSVFQAVVVTLLPTTSTSAPGQVAALRVVVTRSTDGARVQGALVRLRPSGGLPEVRALTGPDGEAVLLVPGVPLSIPGTGGIVVADIAADLDAIVDPALARFNALASLEAARATADARIGPLIDPDDLETRLAASAIAARAVRIAAGQTRIPSPPEIVWTPP